MGKKKRLGDLYRTHAFVECTDDSGDKIPIAVVKINRPDTDSCIRSANAARARLLIHRFQPESELWLEAYGDAADQNREGLLAMLTAEDLAQRQLSAEAQEEALDEWANDEYLDGLRQLWTDELQMEWATNPEDPDAKRVYAELDRFRQAVNKRMEGEAGDLSDAYSHFDDEEVRRKAVVRMIERMANVEWLNEFELQRIFYATRDPLDRGKRYFANAAEVRDLDDRILGQLRREYSNLGLDYLEGKESPETRGSSPPSEPSNEEVPSTPSGPKTSPPSKTSPTSS